MTNHEGSLYLELEAKLDAVNPELIPGLKGAARRRAFLFQLIDSVRRVEFVGTISKRDISPERANGTSPLFDPVRAALLKRDEGQFEEACWLTFLFVHFGRHSISGYRYTAEVYSALGKKDPWTFEETSKNIPAIREWLDKNEAHLRRGTRRGFGNHRKYQSLSGTKKNGTGDAIDTYIQWVRAHGDHKTLFDIARDQSDGTPEGMFEWLYQSMRSVTSFGRIARFDFLTMLGKLGLADIRPGRPYFDSTTKGPNKGARVAFEGEDQLTIAELEERATSLGEQLGVGMQEMEDALCNWGKNPAKYVFFKG
ncbi:MULTISPECIES: hypothetical protein [unclassified Pseudoxanthomonas]|uniref:alpha-glutamyl/putrescinyl thymine pyrophosphorylase clade 3 protein n=1 Tax=unclassified Pseudoxanthomonas TaxID=2645906 RepID=UPI00307E07E7